MGFSPYFSDFRPVMLIRSATQSMPKPLMNWAVAGDMFSAQSIVTQRVFDARYQSQVDFLPLVNGKRKVTQLISLHLMSNFAE